MTGLASDSVETKDIGQPIFDYCQLTTSLGDKVDILQWLEELIVYEDIFSPVLTGYITIRDPINFLERVGLCGAEKLTLKFWSNSYKDPNRLNYIHRTFDVLKLTDIRTINEYTKEYSLWFASPELFKNQTTKISKAFFDCEYSKVVSDIMTGSYEIDEIEGVPSEGLDFPTATTEFNSIPVISPYLNTATTETWLKKDDDNDSVELFIEKTRYKEPIVSFPYMMPFDVINQLAAKSVRKSGGRYATGAETQPANFLFFENKRGFQFVSIDSLLENKDINTTAFKFGSGEQNYTVQNNRVTPYETIERLEVQKAFDILQNLKNGMYTSKLYSLDMSTGVVSEFDYNILENFNKVETTERGVQTEDFPGMFTEADGTNDVLSKKFLAKRMFVINSPEATKNIITSEQTMRQNTTNILSGPAEYLQTRLSSLARLSNYQILFEIAGNSKHKVGDCVNIDLKQLQETDFEKTGRSFESVDSKYYSGNYLLTSIKHVLTKTNYKMVIEACKDSHKAKFGTKGI